MPVFRTVDPVASATLQNYKHRQLLHRARRYIYVKGAINAVIVLLFFLTFPPELKPRMIAIALTDALFLVPYWFLVQRYPTLATGLCLGITSLAISAGDWVGGYQTGASGILYALLILGGHLVLIKPLSTYLIAGLIIAIYAGTITLEVNGVIPIHFPFTLSNLSRVVSLNVISMFGLTILTGVVTRLYRELFQRNKELFALNAISAASQSLSLDKVLQLALDKVLEVMELAGGELYLLETSTGKMVLKTHRNLAEEFVGWVSRLEGGLDGFTDSPSGTGQVVVIDDLSQYPVVSEIVGDGNGPRPLAIVPLKVGDRVLGMMNLLGRTGFSFASQDVELLNTIGVQIGLTIERAQLYNKQRKRAVQLAVVSEVGRRAASILDMDQLLQEVVVAIQQGFSYYNVALSLLDETAGELEVLAIAGGFTDLVLPGYRQAVGVGMAGWAAETGQSLLANDVRQEPRYIRGFLEEPLTKAELCVPLKLAGQVIGVLDVQDTQLNAFDETDLLAMETLADQIAVAIENARLFGEAKRRFEETTALHQTSLDITAKLEMMELLKSIVERAVTLLEAEGGGICLYDPEREDLRWAIGYGHAEKYMGTTLKPGEGMAGKVFQTGEPLIVDDYRTWEGRAPVYEADQPFTAVLEVPLRWQDQTIGVLGIEAGAQKRTFNQDDVWLATLFANQAAIAIENARIFEGERKRVTHLELIGEVTQKIASILDLDELLSQVAHLIRDAFGYYNIGIHLIEADSDELILRAADGPLGEALIDRLRLKIDQESITGWVAHSGEPLLVNDVSREPRYYFVEESKDARSQLAVPIKLKGEIIGVLDALSVELDAFSQDDVSILQTLADQLAIAIENARLYATERQQLHRLKELAAASQQITADLDLTSVLEEIGAQALTTLEADRAAIFLLDWETDRLSCAYSSGLSPEYVDGFDHRHRDSPGSHILNLSEPIHVLDAQTDPATEATQEAMVREGYHTFTVLPLVSKGKLMGALAVYRDTIRAFRPEMLALAQSFANQAAVAIENARLHQEAQHRVEELTFLNRVGRAVTSSLDLKQILATVTEETALLLKTEACSILLLDEESSGLVFEAAHGPQSERVKGLRLPLDQGIAGWVAREGQRCLVPDVGEDPRFYSGIDEITDFVTNSVLAVPLKLKGKVIGLIEAVNKPEGDFSQADMALLSSIGQWAAVAIENARLYQQTDERLQTRVKELSALYTIAEMVNLSLDLDEILQLSLDRAIEVAGMDSGGILVLDPSTSEIFLRAHRGWSLEFIRATSRMRADEGLRPPMLKAVRVVDDLSKLTKDRRIAVEREGLQSLVSIPLKAKESPLGVMVVASYSPRTFASEELELLAAIGNQVGMAVDRAHLRAQELRAAILEERQHMARQMHDDIAQTLGYLGLQVDSVMGSSSLAQNAEIQTELEGIRGAIEDTYERVRSSIIRLQEDIPGHFNLETALQAIITEFEKQSRCRVESKVEGDQLPHLSPSVAFQAIYIIREALTNVRKHSGADSVHLTLQGLEDGRVEVTIQDNGRGFDLDGEQQAGWGGFGLRFMRERAERAGGSLRVKTRPGQGTRVIVNLPSSKGE
jgi:GAF domain-containing protein